MAAAAPPMPTEAHAARVHMRNVLEEACLGLLRRLLEDDIPAKEDKVPECDGVKRCSDEMWAHVRSLEAPGDPQEVARLLQETCGCDQVPPRVLEALAQRLLDSSRRGWYSGDYTPVMRALQRAVLREEKLRAFFAQDCCLSQSLFREIKGLLRGRYWDRIRVTRGHLAQFRGGDAADPEVQEREGGGSNADPEGQVCAGSGGAGTQTTAGAMTSADPEVQASAAGAGTQTTAGGVTSTDPEGERTDLAIGDRRTETGYYIELKKNPKDKETLQACRRKLRAILGAETASAPGNFNTKEENRVCYQIIFYSADELAKVSERPEEMEKLLIKQSSWKHVLDCYHNIGVLPKREVGVCILEVRPDY